MVFRPFKGEVLFARISGCSQEGIHRPFSPEARCSRPRTTADYSAVRTDFFDDILVPYDELPEGAQL